MPLEVKDLFPEPINRRYFLWALAWGEADLDDGVALDQQVWEDPYGPEAGEMGAGDLGGGLFSTEAAVAASWRYLSDLLASEPAQQWVVLFSETYLKYMMDNDPKFAEAQREQRRVKRAIADGTLPPQASVLRPRRDVQDAIQLALI